jgi:hypothetical protein
MTDKPTTGLALMRLPFAANQISKLPKPTKAQTEALKVNFKEGFRCPDCGGWHHPKVDHLDYVGHAALTDRLLECDVNWDWEPLALNDAGLPLYDNNGGLWIKLTVCGVSRLGYGNAAGKPAYGPGDREKEVIGDALRNAGMRFGAALDLWHKGDLHLAAGDDVEPVSKDSGPELISDESRDIIVALASSIAFDIGAILKAHKVKSLKELTAKQGDAAITRLNTKIDEKRIAEEGKE